MNGDTARPLNSVALADYVLLHVPRQKYATAEALFHVPGGSMPLMVYGNLSGDEGLPPRWYDAQYMSVGSWPNWFRNGMPVALVVGSRRLQMREGRNRLLWHMAHRLNVGDHEIVDVAWQRVASMRRYRLRMLYACTPDSAEGRAVLFGAGLKDYDGAGVGTRPARVDAIDWPEHALAVAAQALGFGDAVLINVEGEEIQPC